jgi:hypothetical protein
LAIYYCYTHESFTEIVKGGVIEKFENSGVGVDTTDAIKKLGEIAKQLLAGGATVPGNLAITSNLNVGGGLTTTGAINAGGDLNAGTAKYNTRVGGIWTAPGIYAEHGKNLEIGAGSGNVYIGSASGSAPQNLIVTGGTLTVAGRNILTELDALKANTIKDQDTIDLRLTKGFNPDGGLSYTASTSKGDTMWVAGWGQNENSLRTGQNPNSFVAQWRILRNTR